ncbi:hypothetical protein BDR07DRAFT_1424988 [Suillus spraguei]|nr:hypothetical protein BDR07DRAFT_1424988 [Suillus spraguei]
MSWKSLTLCLLCLGQGCLAYNGMDMSMDDGISLAVGNMLSYLHFTPGDTLWFLGWVPKSSGAMRWIAACREVMEFHWGQQAIIVASETLDTLPTQSALTPPFIPAHDITRGIMFTAQTLLSYLFMLAVMTYQLGFIFSLVVGLGVGETLFGRFGSIAHVH